MRNAVITGRHLVGMAAVALANPLIYFGGGFYQWSITFLTPLLFSAVVYGLYSLFFTKRAKGSWPGSFFSLAWILLGLVVLVPWMDKSPQHEPVTQSASSSKDKNEGVKKKYLTDEEVDFGTSGTGSAPQPWGANDKPVTSYDDWGENDKPVSIQMPHLTTPATNSSGVLITSRDSPLWREMLNEPEFKQWTEILNSDKRNYVFNAKTQDELNEIFVSYLEWKKLIKDHYDRIYAAHPDASSLALTPDFNEWIQKNKNYGKIMKNGSTQEIIDLFYLYKTHINEKK